MADSLSMPGRQVEQVFARRCAAGKARHPGRVGARRRGDLRPGDVGKGEPAQPALVEPDAPPAPPARAPMDGENLPEQAGELSLRDPPDAEEAQHVIDAEGVEELARLLQAVLPPAVPSCPETFPVVRWGSPSAVRPERTCPAAPPRTPRGRNKSRSAQTSALSRLIRMGRSPFRKTPMDCSARDASASCASSWNCAQATGRHCAGCASHHRAISPGPRVESSGHPDHGASLFSFFSAVNTAYGTTQGLSSRQRANASSRPMAAAFSVVQAGHDGKLECQARAVGKPAVSRNVRVRRILPGTGGFPPRNAPRRGGPAAEVQGMQGEGGKRAVGGAVAARVVHGQELDHLQPRVRAPAAQGGQVRKLPDAAAVPGPQGGDREGRLR